MSTKCSFPCLTVPHHIPQKGYKLKRAIEFSLPMRQSDPMVVLTSVLIAMIPMTALGATEGPHSPEAQNGFQDYRSIPSGLDLDHDLDRKRLPASDGSVLR